MTTESLTLSVETTTTSRTPRDKWPLMRINLGGDAVLANRRQKEEWRLLGCNSVWLM
jgi:hypothetical protein